MDSGNFREIGKSSGKNFPKCLYNNDTIKSFFIAHLCSSGNFPEIPAQSSANSGYSTAVSGHLQDIPRNRLAKTGNFTVTLPSEISSNSPSVSGNLHEISKTRTGNAVNVTANAANLSVFSGNLPGISGNLPGICANLHGISSIFPILPCHW